AAGRCEFLAGLGGIDSLAKRHREPCRLAASRPAGQTRLAATLSPLPGATDAGRRGGGRGGCGPGTRIRFVAAVPTLFQSEDGEGWTQSNALGPARLQAR